MRATESSPTTLDYISALGPTFAALAAFATAFVAWYAIRQQAAREDKRERWRNALYRVEEALDEIDQAAQEAKTDEELTIRTREGLDHLRGALARFPPSKNRDEKGAREFLDDCYELARLNGRVGNELAVGRLGVLYASTGIARETVGALLRDESLPARDPIFTAALHRAHKHEWPTSGTSSAEFDTEHALREMGYALVGGNTFKVFKPWRDRGAPRLSTSTDTR